VLTYTLYRVNVHVMRTTLVTWGDEIVRRRKAADMTQRDLAAKVETTQQHLSLIERGAVSPGDDMRLRLAAALDTTVAELFAYPDEVPA
jgi:transcriptional regulator with XRE-family HTH domain